jgi:diguanylate cyclase (GGDEF)-like protein/PAS domain S-box-containing protein
MPRDNRAEELTIQAQYRLIEKLSASDERFQALLNNLKEVVFAIDTTGVWKYLNPAWEEITGYQTANTLGHDFLDHVHPDDRPEFSDAFLRLIHHRQNILHLITRYQHKDGIQRYTEVFAKPVVDDSGGVIEVSGTLNDVTDRILAERLLRMESEKNAAFLRNASDGIHILNTEGIIVEVSDAFCNMLGYHRDEVIGMHVSQCYAAFFDDDISHVVTELFSTTTRSQFEARHRRKDGTIIDVEVSSYSLMLDETPLLFNSSRDITERKKLQAEMHIAATIFESNIGMLITDADNVILRVNNTFSTITGYTIDEVIGKSSHIIRPCLHDSDFYSKMWKTIAVSGSWEGEIWNRRKNGDIYPEFLTITAVKDINGAVTNYVATFTDITMRKSAEDEIKNLAFYDPLTHLPNRRLLLDRLEHALSSSAREERDGALLFLDLDHFKMLNDTLGHDIGDLLLKQVAERLTVCVRENDTVARLGGDEFVIMLENLSNNAYEAAIQAKSAGEKILASISQTYQLGSHEYRNSISIGIALFSQIQSGDELLKHADIAMYHAKKEGRNTLRFFDPQMQINISARAALEADLRKALSKHQFLLHYQIQVDHLNQPLGAEVLLRWLHPDRGLVSPAEFIPLAEETGLILPIGEWVLETACAQLKAWQREKLTNKLTLSVNVSAKQFRQSGFIEYVKSLIQHHEFSPGYLKLELTESMLLEDIEATIAIMNALGALGIQFSLDDFGTGYSSLQYLKRLPLYQLKIDQSFVRDIAIDINDEAIVSTIIAMAKSLNLNVIAEGVETEAQKQILVCNGCTHYQGYLFSKPVPITQFLAQLETTQHFANDADAQ